MPAVFLRTKVLVHALGDTTARPVLIALLTTVDVRRHTVPRYLQFSDVNHLVCPLLSSSKPTFQDAIICKLSRVPNSLASRLHVRARVRPRAAAALSVSEEAVHSYTGLPFP